MVLGFPYGPICGGLCTNALHHFHIDQTLSWQAVEFIPAKITVILEHVQTSEPQFYVVRLVRWHNKTAAPVLTMKYCGSQYSVSIILKLLLIQFVRPLSPCS